MSSLNSTIRGHEIHPFKLDHFSYETYAIPKSLKVTFLGTNMAMENPPFERVFPIEHGDFPASHTSLPEGSLLDLLSSDVFCHPKSTKKTRQAGHSPAYIDHERGMHVVKPRVFVHHIALVVFLFHKVTRR